MRRLDARLLLGLLLIAAGVIYLLQNLGIIQWGALVWSVALGLGGLAFLGVYIRDRAMWWALIPGLTLLGLSAMLALEYFAPAVADSWGGSIFLGSIGLSFWLVYAADRQMWWSIIPGGVLVTLAAVAAIDNQSGLDSGAVFFMGLGATFLLVALAPTPHGQMRWAYFPAAILLAFGLLLAVGFASALGYLWPVALILGGVYLLIRAFRRGA